jgi:hypothetical protein
MPASNPLPPNHPKTDAPAAPLAGNLGEVATARELFWQNVLREMLTSLSALGASNGGTKVLTDAGGNPIEGDPFDGRLAIITALGQRIPIAGVEPLFACGIPTSDADKALSMAVECTVFQIRTPDGEVFTLPLHEIRGLHSLSGELVELIKQNAADQPEPFGFAAYTSLARTNLPIPISQPSDETPPPT